MIDFFKSTAGMVLIVTILVGIAVHAATGNFFTAYNISTLTRAASFIIIMNLIVDLCYKLVDPRIKLK